MQIFLAIASRIFIYAARILPRCSWRVNWINTWPQSLRNLMKEGKLRRVSKVRKVSEVSNYPFSASGMIILYELLMAVIKRNSSQTPPHSRWCINLYLPSFEFFHRFLDYVLKIRWNAPVFFCVERSFDKRATCDSKLVPTYFSRRTSHKFYFIFPPSCHISQIIISEDHRLDLSRRFSRRMVIVNYRYYYCVCVTQS